MAPVTRRALGKLGLAGLAALAGGRSGTVRSEGSRGEGPLSLIVLWLDGGPSQLETFDPKPGTAIGGPTKAIGTSIEGVTVAASLEQTAEQLQHISLIRSVVGDEGDHERARIQLQTGRRPEVVLQHPALGSVLAHELPEAGTEIPRFVSILGPERKSRAGFLGPRFDPFSLGDPAAPIRDVEASVGEARFARRLDALESLERGFAARHPGAEARTHHRERTERALRTMRSPQLDAFDLSQESRALRSAYGDHAFGRGCLAARRLVEVGVRCVEVTLGGWDTHVDNFETCRDRCATLDPALATLIRDLRERDRWRSTVIACGGEFGRTPRINATEGRDHWPGGFSMLVGGGPIVGGQVIGETAPDAEAKPRDPVPIKHLYATLLAAMGLDPEVENITSSGRPVKLGEGSPLRRLLRT